MNNSINNAATDNNLSANLPADTVENRARMQLAFIGSLFVSCATIAYLQMGEVVVSSQGVPVIGAMLGM